MAAARVSRLVVRRYCCAAAEGGPLGTYQRCVDLSRLKPDASQLSAMGILQEFFDAAERPPPLPSPPPLPPPVEQQQQEGRQQNADVDRVAIDGVYLWGSVGSGKSMLMDLFVGSCADAGHVVMRKHFHELMLDVHKQMHEMHAARPKTVILTKQGLPVYKYVDEPPEQPAAAAEGVAASDDASAVDGDAQRPDGAEGNGAARKAPTSEPLERIIGSIRAQASLLCLDEMQVTDVADAMILRQLFEGLFQHGVRVVFTSNRPPEGLYERGLNRRYFLPFVDMLRQRCAVVRVGGDGADAVDYRQLAPTPFAPNQSQLPGSSLRALASRPRGVYLSGAAAGEQLAARWQRHCEGVAAPDEQRGRAGGDGAARRDVLPVGFGRSLAVPSRAGDACRFTFDELCGRRPGEAALGPADYLALARAASCVYLADVPVLSRASRNEARRFVTLVDALYEARVELCVAAAAPLDGLVAPLLAEEEGGGGVAEGAEVEVGRELGASYAPRLQPSAGGPSFEEAPVGGRFRVDGELAAFFTAKDEAFMLLRTISRLREMCEESST